MDMSSNKKNRIVFIDLLRALAVLMMVQGHTVDVLLANEHRDFDHPVFSTWSFLRGMTAPIFLFTSGAVFTYLFKLAGVEFNRNPRVSKGFTRFLLLVGLGYLLRYPTAEITDFAFVTAQSWQTFFAVDVLQLIGFSLLFLLISSYLAEKFRVSDYLVFALGAIFFFACFPVFERIAWSEYLPAVVAGYFYSGAGSNFPLFPWAGYVLCGGILGSYLTSPRYKMNPGRLSYDLAIGSAIFLALYWAVSWAAVATFGGGEQTSIATLMVLRLGVVLLICSVVSFAGMRLKSIPPAVVLTGHNSLPIYVMHVVILYGSAWNVGLNQFFDRSLNPWASAGSALLMIAAMIGLVVLWKRGSTLFKETFVLSGRFN
jgi:uncharacterized membrane protein